MKIKNGVFPQMLSEFKKAAGPENKISAKETRTILAKGLASMKAEFKDADSEKGIAAYRNALAKTFRAADHNWYFGAAAERVAHGFLGANLDGKGGSLAAVEKKLRSA